MSFKLTVSVAVLSVPLIASAGVLDDAKAKIRKEREDAAIATLSKDYAPEIAKYRANPERAGMKCYLEASAHWSAWSGMPKSEMAACDEVVRKEIVGIRLKEEEAVATAKAERAERRKGMSEVAAKLDEMDERQQDRERALDRRDAARQAVIDADAERKAKNDAADAEIARAKRLSCSMGNKRDC
ncbi:hypothetical protein ACN9MZ_27360 [Pseudoduganella sp. S-14]|uniref:hypothetical protein n=1 Tax=Pseudoduganella sp. S-14 TaxID=3404065 RepID=UPI003CEC4905